MMTEKTAPVPLLLALFLAGVAGGCAAVLWSAALRQSHHAMPVLLDAYGNNGLLKLYIMDDKERLQYNQLKAAVSQPRSMKIMEELTKSPDRYDLYGAVRLGIDVPGFGRRGDVILIWRRRTMLPQSVQNPSFGHPWDISEIWVNVATGKRVDLFPVRPHRPEWRTKT